MNMACINWLGEGGGRGWRNWITASFLSDRSIAIVRGWDLQRASRVARREAPSTEIPPPERGAGRGSPPCQCPGHWEREAVPVLCRQRDGARSLASPATGWICGGRRKAEKSPAVARGKAGFLLEGKRPGSAFRATCLGRGHCHRPRSRGTSRGQRGRGFSRSPCSGSLRCPAGSAAWGKAAGSLPWKTRAF